MLIIFQASACCLELYGITAYLSQNASKNREWILSVYTVLTLCLSFLNFGLSSLGLRLCFYLFLLCWGGGRLSQTEISCYYWIGLVHFEPYKRTAIKIIKKDWPVPPSGQADQCLWCRHDNDLHNSLLYVWWQRRAHTNTQSPASCSVRNTTHVHPLPSWSF